MTAPEIKELCEKIRISDSKRTDEERTNLLIEAKVLVRDEDGSVSLHPDYFPNSILEGKKK